MKVLRTPEKSFKDLKNYPYKPHYTVIESKKGDNFRIHHIEEGPKKGPTVVCFHGQPAWSYLYTKMIPYFLKEQVRIICPDLPGYGKSDKPSKREDYSYQNQVDWMVQWLKKNRLENLTLFGQDWGGLIGLRVVAQEPERFNKVVVGNTGLPYNPNVSKSILKEREEFIKSGETPTLYDVYNNLKGMKGKSPKHQILKFMYWQKYCWDTEDLPVGLLMSMIGGGSKKLSTILYYAFVQMGAEKFFPFKPEIAKAFDAPFPSIEYKMGVRSMPMQVPIIPDSSLAAQKKARDFFKSWNKPFLCAFAGNDPITNSMEKDVLKMCPKALKAPYVGGGHFYQWTKPKELSDIITKFVKADS
jgi:haloalkane dehalogenase